MPCLFYRAELLNLILDQPTIFEIVTRPPNVNKERHKGITSNASSMVNRSAPEASNPSKVSQATSSTQKKEKVEDMDIREGAEDSCGICGLEETSNEECWIACDECKRWFHVRCVHFKCHECSNN
jgi:hypothetical protein